MHSIKIQLVALTRAPPPDILGVSALVDAINHRCAAGATASTVLGPFHVNHDVMKPLWGNISEGQSGAASFVSGRVLDTEGAPVGGAIMDFWQTDGEKGAVASQSAACVCMRVKPTQVCTTFNSTENTKCSVAVIFAPKRTVFMDFGT